MAGSASVSTLPEKQGRNDPTPFVLQEDDGIVELLVDSILPAEALRVNGLDAAHTELLVETDAVLPSILVHRATMRVIDGAHRIQAAKNKGAKVIRARFFDGTDGDAFVLAIKSNIAHGLALSLADRKAASRRVIMLHPQWSDRKVAEVTGLTHKTVGVIRRQLGGEIPQSTARVGRDGRVRPLNGDVGRRRASELLRDNPNASQREVGRTTGISPSTVHDVRRRLRDGEDPIPPRHHTDPNETAESTVLSTSRPGPATRPDSVTQAPGSWTALIRRLTADPSLRLSESGRTLLRWLTASPRSAEESTRLARSIPEHSVPVIAALARQNAHNWQILAARLDHRLHATANTTAAET